MPLARTTQDQVLNKMYEAKRRTMKAIETALLVQHDEEAYHNAVQDGCKAANDYNVWYKVWHAIKDL